MTDLEFEVLDHLYFMISWHDLVSKTKLEPNALLDTLQLLQSKSWIQVYQDRDQLPIENQLLSEETVPHLYFLATKKGLFAHNQL